MTDLPETMADAELMALTVVTVIQRAEVKFWLSFTTGLGVGLGTVSSHRNINNLLTVVSAICVSYLQS